MKKLVCFVGWKDEDILKYTNGINSYMETMDMVNRGTIEYFCNKYMDNFAKRFGSAYQDTYWCNTNKGEFTSTVFFKRYPSKMTIENMRKTMLNGGSARLYLKSYEQYGSVSNSNIVLSVGEDWFD